MREGRLPNPALGAHADPALGAHADRSSMPGSIPVRFGGRSHPASGASYARSRPVAVGRGGGAGDGTATRANLSGFRLG